MIRLRLPGNHPDQAVISRWAGDKEQMINQHNTDIKQLQGIIKTILSNNPELGKPK